MKTLTPNDLSKAFVSKHLATYLRKRNLMLGNNGSLEKIKEILGNYFIHLSNKVEEVAHLAKKKIIKPQFIETAYSMM